MEPRLIGATLRRHAERDRAVRASSFRAVEGDHLGHGRVKTDLQALDLAEPAVDTRFVDTIPEVLNDRSEPGAG